MSYSDPITASEMFADDIVICSGSRQQVKSVEGRKRPELERRGFKSQDEQERVYTSVNKSQEAKKVRKL